MGGDPKGTPEIYRRAEVASLKRELQAAQERIKQLKTSNSMIAANVNKFRKDLVMAEDHLAYARNENKRLQKIANVLLFTTVMGCGAAMVFFTMLMN